MRSWQVLAVAVTFFSQSVLSEETRFPPECPSAGTMEIVADPGTWADRCFQATSGRPPSNSHETSTLRRDIDLDGTLELLEVRGVGMALKQIFVFSQSEDGFRYIGELHAHPSFRVVPGPDKKATILNRYRSGAANVFLQEIQYIDGRFTLIKQEPMR